MKKNACLLLIVITAVLLTAASRCGNGGSETTERALDPNRALAISLREQLPEIQERIAEVASEALSVNGYLGPELSLENVSVSVSSGRVNISVIYDSPPGYMIVNRLVDAVAPYITSSDRWEVSVTYAPAPVLDRSTHTLWVRNGRREGGLR